MSSRAAAGRKRQTKPLSDPKSPSKFGKSTPAAQSTQTPYPQPFVDAHSRYGQAVVPDPSYAVHQLGTTRDRSRSSPSPYAEIQRAPSPPLGPRRPSVPELYRPGEYEVHNQFSPQPVSQTYSQPGLSRSPAVSPSRRPQPVISSPRPYEPQHGSFQHYSLPSSQSFETLPGPSSQRMQGTSIRSQSPYQSSVGSPRSGPSPLSSTSGTPTATSFTSIRSIESDYTAIDHLNKPPPSSYNRFIPSPSSSSITVDNLIPYQPQRPPSVSSGSQSSGRESEASFRNQKSSSSSGSQGTSSDKASSFVFPSSRSRAVPTGTGPPRFRFKSKKKKEKERIASEQRIQAQLQVKPGPPILTIGQPSSPPATSVSFAEPTKLSSPASSTRSPRSASSDGSQGFVFPSSRSRAHPDPSKKSKSPKTPTSDSDVGSGSPSSPRFMGINLNRKKKKKKDDFAVTPAIPEDFPSPIFDYSGDHFQNEMRSHGESSSHFDHRTTAIHKITKAGTYPLDPYDSMLLECDRQTGELLRQLNVNATGTPSWYPYGTNPPATILDLGCGKGHWMLDAAIAWKGYGTRITGVDMVDITKNLRSIAVKHGVSDNISFVKTNFLTKQLPFPDESFDMVRMSCLTFCISFDKWEYLLKEVCRVLTVGGRLELIDDHVFFAYGKPPMSPPPSEMSPSVPRLEVMIPSARMSTIGPPPSISSSSSIRDDDSELYALYEDDETATLNGGASKSPRSPIYPPPPSSSGAVSIIQSLYPDSWTESALSAKQLESLFEHMMNVRYGIHLCPSEFILQMMERVFGHSREMENMHITLAPPMEEDPPDPNGSDNEPEDIDPLSNSPGLVLWPSTFIPMPRAEIEAHALKHNRVLLSSKLALAEYALDISDEEDVEDEGVKEALWEYENFLHQRFNPPPGAAMTSSGSSISSGDDIDRATINGLSDKMSVFSMSSVTSENRAAIREYQSDFRQHFGWSDEPASPNSTSSHNTIRMPLGTLQPQLGPPQGSPPSPSISTLPPSFQSRRDSRISTVTANPPPNYSRFEPTHVRTFHVYEAIKMDIQSE